MAFEPGPMQVVKGAFSTKGEVFADLEKLDFWPTTYVSERMDELPAHWHDFDIVGYVLEGRTYLLNHEGERFELEKGDKLMIPRGAVHAEGQVLERIVYIIGIPLAERMADVFADLKDPAMSPLANA